MKYLPIELINNIVGFVNNIDVRINFNVFNKLKLLKYLFLSKIMRKNLLYSKQENCKVKLRYNLFNCEKINKRNEDKIDNDLLEIDIEEKDNKLYYALHIFRLKKKPFLQSENLSNIYYQNIYQDKYYWDYNIVKFIKY